MAGVVSPARTGKLDLFTDLLKEGVLGLLLNEVGNMSDLVTVEGGQERLEEVLVAAFEKAGATEHGLPQFLWSKGETMAAFRSEVQVLQLEPLTRMKRVDPRRAVERFEVIGATEHGPCSLLIYNTHQPQSTNRPFKPTMQIDFL